MKNRTTATARLDPVGRLRLPGRRTTLRAGLVAVLLLTAAGVLYAGAYDTPADAPDRAAPPGHAATSPPPDPLDPLDPPDPLDPRDPPDLLAHPDRSASDGQRLPIPSGLVGVPVPLREPAALAMLLAGDHVDLVAVPEAGGDLVPVASNATVLATDPATAAVLLALTPDQAYQVVSAPATTRFAIIIRG